MAVVSRPGHKLVVLVSAEEWQRLEELESASLAVLPGAAHMSPFTDPAALARLILRGRLE